MFTRNQWVIGEQTKGLTHADSLLQPDMRGNCLNLFLGICWFTGRKIMKMLSLEPLPTDDQFKRYNYGADPVLEDGPEVIPLEELLALLEKLPSCWREDQTAHPRRTGKRG